jgi:hypothetical protein
MKFTMLSESDFMVEELYADGATPVNDSADVVLYILEKQTDGSYKIYDWDAVVKVFTSGTPVDSTGSCTEKTVTIEGPTTKKLGIYQSPAINYSAFTAGRTYVFYWQDSVSGDLVGSPSETQWGGQYGDISTKTDQGSPADLGSGATLADNLKNIADNNNGTTYDPSTDSLNVAATLQNTIDGKVDTAITDIGTVDGKVDTAITDINTVDGKVDTAILGIATIDGKVGVPIALDGGLETIASMLTKMADDNDGADFEAATDSLHELSTGSAASVIAALENNDNWKKIRSFACGNVVISAQGEWRFYNETNTAILFKFTPISTGRTVT